MIFKTLSDTQTNTGTPAIRPAGLHNQSINSPAGDSLFPSSSPLTPYLELVANVSKQARLHNYVKSLGNNLESVIPKNVDYFEELLHKKCPGFFVIGTCPRGHRVAKETFCGKEWCPVCGEYWSPAHQRRFARWLTKALQIGSMGYFVFTIPEELRKNYRTRKALKEFGHHIQEMMKAQGYRRGLRRWHFFGDKSIKYNPHLNILVEADYLNPSELDTIKKVYAVLLGIDMADVYYEYSSEPEKKAHMVKYVTRATFCDYEWDTELALELRGFRNQVAWGRGLWNDEPVWSLDDMAGDNKVEVEGFDVKAVEALEASKCHKCGEPITWAGVRPIYFLNDEPGRRSLGAGYWELPDLDLLPAERWRIPYLEKLHYWQAVCRRLGVEAVPAGSCPGQDLAGVCYE